jgi:mRNA interferase MazF
MNKNFDQWNKLKKVIDTEEKRTFFHEREVWFCKLGVNVGFEQDGKGDDFMRPVLIFKKFNKQIFIGIPLTTSLKTNKYHFLLNNKKSAVILSQLRLIDTKRLSHRIEKVSENEISQIKEKLRDLIL